MKPLHTLFFPILFLALFAAQFLFLSPIGEFALNDDWVHTDTIKYWVETGEFRMLPFAGPTFYTPILYGGALIKLFGFSFTLLRISTLVLALGALLLLYVFLRRLAVPPLLAFGATLLLWLNPLFYNVSFTFMTDVPALFFLVAGITLYFRGFETKNVWWFFWATLIAVIGFYTRQTTLLIVPAAGILALARHKQFGLHHLIWSFGVPLVMGAGAYTFLFLNDLLPESIDTHIIKGAGRMWGHVKWWSWYIPLYLGVLLLPLSLAAVAANKHMAKDRRIWLLAFLFVTAAVLIRQLLHLQFPYIGNIISLYGLGAIHGVIAGALLPLFPSSVWGILTLIAAGGTALLVFLFFPQRQMPDADAPGGRGSLVRIPDSLHFLILFAAFYTIPLLFFEGFDRYLLPLFLALLVLLAVRLRGVHISYPVLFLLITALGVYSVSQTRHYLLLSEAQWELADTARAQGASVSQIDGGYVWLGWYGYWDALRAGIPPAEKIWPHERWWIKGLYTNNTSDFIVSISPLPGYEVVETRELPFALNPNNTVYLLEKRF